MKSSINKAGTSDHHRRICTFLKSTYAKGKPKFVYNRSLKTSKNYLRKIFQEIWKTLVIGLNFLLHFPKHFTLLCPFGKEKILSNHTKFEKKYEKTT